MGPISPCILGHVTLQLLRSQSELVYFPVLCELLGPLPRILSPLQGKPELAGWRMRGREEQRSGRTLLCLA